MNLKTLEKLEFDKICKILSDFAITYIGKKMSLELSPFSSKEEIGKSLSQTSEAVTLLYRLGNAPISDIANITIHLKHL